MIAVGVLSIINSVLILICKDEKNPKKLAIESERVQMEKLDCFIESETNTVIQTYSSIKEILFLRPIHKVIFLFLTYRVGLNKQLYNMRYIIDMKNVLMFKIGVSSEIAMRLKLVEYGVAREKISLLSVLISPIMIIVPIFLSRFVKGPTPLNVLFNIYPYKYFAYLFGIF